MKKHEIKIGGKYLMRVSGNIVPVRIDDIRETESYGLRPQRRTIYDCTNLQTGRKCRAMSAQKFRSEVRVPTEAKDNAPPDIAKCV